MGPLVPREQFDRVTGYLAAGREEGADRSCGRFSCGRHRTRAASSSRRFHHVTDDMTIAGDAIFSPVLSAIPVNDCGCTDPAATGCPATAGRTAATATHCPRKAVRLRRR
ncbi:aldehyde dehydrogenase family protein [Dactylosporangium sp. CA-052675]|uniref:aldehyde dehydrogenase family protein n=1 Tax=Dactylosporangium sp. CA-052675 TaxID=3239927 RepID=UPI003D93BF81